VNVTCGVLADHGGGQQPKDKIVDEQFEIYSQRGVLRTEHLLESLRLLQKFLTERTPLRAHFVSRSGNVSASVSGVLLELPPDSLMVGSRAPGGALLSFRIGADCEFEYGHGREAPESLQESNGTR